MASWQAHVLDLLMRVQVKRKVRHITTVEQARTVLNGGVLPIPAGITFQPDTIGGISAEWTQAAGTPHSTLLYLHGGGYFACSPRTHRPFAAAYAQQGFRVFMPDYRLAPEHPFPSAVQDALAAWHGLVAQGNPPASLTVSGDSAGGGLTLALLLSLRDQGQSLPAAAALFSPWTDLAVTGDSVRSNARREAMFTAPGLSLGAGLYLASADPKTPLASPLYAELAGLPPLLIHCGNREMLRDDSVRLAQRAAAAGVRTELRVWPVVPHVWQLAQFVPEAKQSMLLAGNFLRNAKP
jgi:acetyl esterase/lipase